MSKTVLSVGAPKRHLCKVTFADGSVLELDSDYCLALSLREGESLTESEIKNHKAASDFERARSRALWYLSRSDHSEKALKDKLIKAGFEREISQKAVLRIKELGLLNDEALCARLAEAFLSENRSLRETEQKLILKGLPRDLVKSVLSEAECDPKEQIRTLVLKKYKNKLSNEDDVRKTVAALMRKGFRFSDIKAALKSFSNELYECEEF